MRCSPLLTGREWLVVDLLLQVSRSADNRLSGTVRATSQDDARPFSGTLELMRVFEELVPVAACAADSKSPGAAGQAPIHPGAQE